MSSINSNYSKLQAGYLFPEIARRTKAYKEANPTAPVIRLGIGDTTEPLVPSVVSAMTQAVAKLGNRETYTGYGDSEGTSELRSAISSYYNDLGCNIEVSEVFVSDGAKSDCANIQSIFGESVVSLQDPAYPVYVDSNVMSGRTGVINPETRQYEGLVYLAGTEANGFIADVPSGKVDLIYLCFPNNPTGAVATREQLQKYVDYAIANKAVIIYDAAYSWFIKDNNIPKSIYEIKGAETCAIELNSFSKWAGFTGVRLGWSIVPKALVVEGVEAGKINWMWMRRQNTFFNGASNIAQAGGVASLSVQGRAECQATVDFYLENAQLIKAGLEKVGFSCYGGSNAPYIWLKTKDLNGNGVSSWDFFDLLLNNCNVVGTPGSGFGPAGEGFFRLSAFGSRANVVEAIARIQTVFGK
jgi:LL-diaminopimelate aminotransferase